MSTALLERISTKPKALSPADARRGKAIELFLERANQVHSFQSADGFGSSCMFCWGWVDDYRHLGSVALL